MTNTMLGKWSGWYKNLKHMSPFRYGDTVTYKLAAEFLSGLSVEDWGCGAAGYKVVHKGPYIGVDGTKNPFVDKVADLTVYRSQTEGIMMRHVLEHNYQWEEVLKNAVASFTKRFCLVIFTPFQAETHEIAHNKKHGVDAPDIGFSRADIEKHLEGTKWRMEEHKTGTHYGVEYIYFIEK